MSFRETFATARNKRSTPLDRKKALISGAALGFTLLFEGVVLWKLWGWFVAGWFSIGHFPLPVMIGVVLIVRLLFARPKLSEETGMSPDLAGYLGGITYEWLTFPVIVLIMGYVLSFALLA